MSPRKARCLVVGMGGVGTMAAYALEIGGGAEVTAVMGSNFKAVQNHGISIESVEYGTDIKGWRPTTIRQTIPDVVKERIEPFDYILVTTKNIVEVRPTVAEIIAPAVTANKTCVVLSQNGLNIERSLVSTFPKNPIVSSVSMINATQKAHGQIIHELPDCQKIGPFSSVQVPAEISEAAAKKYIKLYNAHKNLDISYDADVTTTRWRKLLYNSSYNSVAAILRMDTTRMRMSEHIIDDLIRPIMLEIQAAAKTNGVYLADDIIELLIRVDDPSFKFKPSMCQDIERNTLIEFESIIGEPLREGQDKGVPMPILSIVYRLLKGLQLHAKESRGLWESIFAENNPYK